MNRTLMLLALVACGGDKPGTDSAGTTTDKGGCPNTVLEQFPADGEADAYYLTSVDFLLAQANTDASVMVMDDAGAMVAGTVSHLDRRVIFTPDEPLAHGGAYTAELTWECDAVTGSFTVGQAGTATVAGADLAGRTWGFAITEGRIVDPPELADLLPLMAQFDILMTATSADDTSIDFIGAVTDEATGEQSLCAPHIDFPTPADYAGNPTFSVQADSMELVVVGDSIPVTDLVLSGTFTDGGAAISGTSLSGIVELGAELCDVLAGSGLSCEACPGGGDECVDLVIDDMTADERSTAVFEWSSSDFPSDCE